MKKLPPQCWCDHEFVVLRNSEHKQEAHLIALFENESAITDEVTSPEGRLLRCAIRHSDIKEEELYNAQGQVVSIRNWRTGAPGTLVLSEISPGTTRSEKRMLFTNEGQLLIENERLYLGNRIQSEAESRYNTDGTKTCTNTTYFDQVGRVLKGELITWFNDTTPAVKETTEFDEGGYASSYVKCMYNRTGAVLWQETTYFPEKSATPSKKELLVFSTKTQETFMNVSEYRDDGSVVKKVLKMLNEAGNSGSPHVFEPAGS